MFTGRYSATFSSRTKQIILTVQFIKCRQWKSQALRRFGCPVLTDTDFGKLYFFVLSLFTGLFAKIYHPLLEMVRHVVIQHLLKFLPKKTSVKRCCCCFFFFSTFLLVLNILMKHSTWCLIECSYGQYSFISSSDVHSVWRFHNYAHWGSLESFCYGAIVADHMETAKRTWGMLITDLLTSA